MLTWEPKHVLPAGDEVVATDTWSAKTKPTGRTFAADWAMVFGVRGGQITSFRVGEDTAKVAAALRGWSMMGPAGISRTHHALWNRDHPCARMR